MTRLEGPEDGSPPAGPYEGLILERLSADPKANGTNDLPVVAGSSSTCRPGPRPTLVVGLNGFGKISSAEAWNCSSPATSIAWKHEPGLARRLAQPASRAQRIQAAAERIAD